MPALTPFQTIEHPYTGTSNHPQPHPFTGSSNGRAHNSIFTQYKPRSNQTVLYRDQMSKPTATQTQTPSQTPSEKKQKPKPKSFFFSIQPQDQIDSQVSKMSSNTSSSSSTTTTTTPQQKPYAPSLYAESTMSTSTTRTTKPLLRSTSNSSNTSTPTHSKRKTTGFRHKTKKFLSSLGEPPTAAWEREQALARADALAASEQGMDEKTKRERRIEEQRRVQLAFAMDYGPMSRGGPWNGRSTFT